MTRIAFRPMTRDDFADVVRWHDAPHAAQWFHNAPHDLAAAEAEFGPCVDGTDPTKLYVLLIDGKSAGYLQHYLVDDYPPYRDAIGGDAAAAAAIDFIIGEEPLTGSGLGPLMLAQFIRDVVLHAHPGVHRVISSPDVRNERSLRALEKAGFRRGDVFTIDANHPPERACVLDIEDGGKTT
jgi:aminoglycoside 6'-N-acetyltransferase